MGMRSKEGIVNKVVYISKSHIERREAPLRIADLPGESMPVIFSVHGTIAEHYKINPAKLTESHSSTIDYVISAPLVECSALSEVRWRRAKLMPAVGD
jgi:hypothetical protein